jgi:DNA-binding MarR family transcriptional regulator
MLPRVGRKTTSRGRERDAGGVTYNSYVPKTTTLQHEAPPSSVRDRPVERIQTGLQTVARAIAQVKLHERLLLSAGVRLDRAGSHLLYKLYMKGSSMRVTELAEQLQVDAPTVTRKIQQLERDGLVGRHADPDDRRATQIELTSAGKRTIERVNKARRAWLESLLSDWDTKDLDSFAELLGRFADGLSHEIGDGHGN